MYIEKHKLIIFTLQFSVAISFMLIIAWWKLRADNNEGNTRKKKICVI